MHGNRIRNNNVVQHAVLVTEGRTNMYGPRIKRVINLLQGHVIYVCVATRGKILRGVKNHSRM